MKIKTTAGIVALALAITLPAALGIANEPAKDFNDAVVQPSHYDDPELERQRLLDAARKNGYVNDKYIGHPMYDEESALDKQRQQEEFEEAIRNGTVQSTFSEELTLEEQAVINEQVRAASERDAIIFSYEERALRALNNLYGTSYQFKRTPGLVDEEQIQAMELCVNAINSGKARGEDKIAMLVYLDGRYFGIAEDKAALKQGIREVFDSYHASQK